MKPNLFLLGAQKSGSTFLRYSLNQHPDISINSLEDKTFEDPEYKQYNGDFRHLDKKTEKIFYGIARPDYFGELKYMKRIKKYSPDSKIIIVLRDPTLRAISSYYHYMKYGIIPAKHPNYLLKIFSENFQNSKYYAYLCIKKYGLYFKQLKRLYTLFRRENVIIIKFDDLVSENNHLVFKNIFQFLGLKNLKLTKPKKTLQKSQYVYKKYLFNKLYLHKKYYYDVKRTKSYSIPYSEMSRYDQVYFNLFSIFSLALFKDKKSDDLSKDIYKKINNYYNEDLKKLKNILDFEIEGWIR